MQLFTIIIFFFTETIIMKCPFISRLSTSFVKNYGPFLFRKYGNLCPVMGTRTATSMNFVVEDDHILGEKGIESSDKSKN